MDFDFTFVTLVALWVLLISMNSEKEIIIDLRSNTKFEKTKKFGSYICIAGIIILTLIEGNIMISKICLNNGNYTLARKILLINPTNDWRVDSYLADTYKQQYDETSDKQYLNESIKLLEETRKK